MSACVCPPASGPGLFFSRLTLLDPKLQNRYAQQNKEIPDFKLDPTSVLNVLMVRLRSRTACACAQGRGKARVLTVHTVFPSLFSLRRQTSWTSSHFLAVPCSTPSSAARRQTSDTRRKQRYSCLRRKRKATVAFFIPCTFSRADSKHGDSALWKSLFNCFEKVAFLEQDGHGVLHVLFKGLQPSRAD